MKVRILTYAGIIQSLRVPAGAVVSRTWWLGFYNLDDYIAKRPYFNLASQGSGGVHALQLKITAKKSRSIDATLIPTGEIARVAGTPLNFRKRSAWGNGSAPATSR